MLFFHLVHIQTNPKALSRETYSRYMIGISLERDYFNYSPLGYAFNYYFPVFDSQLIFKRSMVLQNSQHGNWLLSKRGFDLLMESKHTDNLVHKQNWYYLYRTGFYKYLTDGNLFTRECMKFLISDRFNEADRGDQVAEKIALGEIKL